MKGASSNSSSISSSNNSPVDCQADHRERLVSFYSLHDPTKVVRVDEFLKKYKGKESDMWAKLRAKYGKP